MTTISDFIRISTPIEFKRSSISEGIVSGYPSTFNGPPDSYGDVVLPGAFQKSLARHRAAGTAPLMLWGHDPQKPVGRWTEFAEDQYGLKMHGAFNLNTSAGRDAHAHVAAGDLNGLSIGYRVMPGGAKAGANGVRYLSELDLPEVSIVGMPADARARITGVKSFGSRADLESILREHLPARAVKKLLSGGWPAVSGDEDDDQTNPAIESLLARVKAARYELKQDRK